MLRAILGCMALIMLCQPGAAEAQTGFWGSPENLGPPVNTTQNELSGIITDSGDKLYFSRTVAGQNDLFVSNREGDTWGRPAAVTALNTTLYNELNPTFNPDGSRMFFASDREGGAGEFDIWTSEWTGTAWSAPVPLGPEINSANSEWYAAPGPSGIYLSARKESGLNRGDIYYAPGTYPDYEMRSEIPALATAVREMSVYPAGEILYITRGAEGAQLDDLWLSVHDGENWTEPTPVLCDVNSADYDQYPTPSPDQSELLFASYNQPQGVGASDLYVSRWHVLGDMTADGQATSSDIVYMVNYLFRQGPSPLDPRVEDLTCDSRLSILDVVVLVNYVLRRGPVPCLDCSNVANSTSSDGRLDGSVLFDWMQKRGF